MQKALFQYALRLGDNALILSQRLSQWCGKGPALEEDMALTNVALDLLGQARLWLDYAGELEGAGRDQDSLAFLRAPHEYYNLLLVEQPNGHYGDTLARQWYFDVWHSLLLQRLAGSAEPRIAAIAEKSEKEARYHLRRSSDLVIRLGDGSELSRSRMQQSVDDLWMFTGEMFVGDDVDAVLVAEGIAPAPESLRAPWLETVGEVLREATLTAPAPDAWMQKGGKQGVHGEHLGHLLTEMQWLQRSYPGAQW